MNMELRLETPRLRVFPLTTAQLEKLIESTPALEKELGLAASGTELDTHTREAMASLLELAAGTPDAAPWITNWQIVLKERNITIGSACFMSVPDENGEVEIGYGIHPEFHGCGYMSEALNAIAQWALDVGGAATVTAETEPDNPASRRVLSKCGFIPCGPTRFVKPSPGRGLRSGAVVAALKASGSAEKAVLQQRFFKTGKGQYGEGDRFIGVKNPDVRLIAKTFRRLPPPEAAELVRNEFHEIRLCGLLIMAAHYRRGGDEERNRIFELYSELSGSYVNNWDLVDLSAPDIAGEHALTFGAEVLERFAGSPLLWRQRIAVVGSLTLIRHGEFAETFALAERFLKHRHDLMHKACGWMLREIGKRDRAALTVFLMKHRSAMPRTMLRYAIEHYPEPERKALLGR
ncbi:MAG: GNAT family N-acetyltransferase [Victivallaceae bacterium]|nr:GNAT family N-acetyltransferase [Victivallaceae bacterium]